MKKLYTTTIVIVILGGLFVNSCKDILNVPPKGSLNKQVLANKKGAETLLIGAYSALDGQNVGSSSQWASAPDNWIYGSVAGGDAHKGSSPGDQPAIDPIAAGDSKPSNSFFNDKWKADYEGISRCNSVLQLLPSVDDATDVEKKEIEAEARFLRGHYYFDLKKMFNNTPWIDENITDYNQPNDTDIWPNIEADFKFAMDNLPETQSDVGRANKWAAASYLAKAFAFEHKWEKAKPIYDNIIANGQTSNGLAYQLVDQFENNFRAKTENNSESVFAIQYTVKDGTGTIANANAGDVLNYPYPSPLKCCGFFQPTQDLVNSYRTNPKTGLPIVSTADKFAYDDTEVTSDQGIPSSKSFKPYKGTLDPRLDWTVGRRGVPYLDWGPHPGKKWVRDQGNGGPYAPQKNAFWQATRDQYFSPNSFGPGTAINYPIIRYADVLLMAAETEANLGNLEKARQYVNMVRNRAANPTGRVSYEYNKPFAKAVVSSQAEMLASDANPGEWVVRMDTKSTWVLLKDDARDIDNWNEYKDPNYKISAYPGPWSDKDAALLKIHFERKLELAMEGHRFFDLVRWGTAPQQLNHFYQYEGSLFLDIRNGHFTEPKNNYYPIPQAQIDLSAKNKEQILQQNPGY